MVKSLRAFSFGLRYGVVPINVEEQRTDGARDGKRKVGF